MTKERWQRLNRKELADLARKKGIAGYRSPRKHELIAALAALGPTKQTKKRQATPRSRPQIAAAHNNAGRTAAQEPMERRKYDGGAPTRDLSAKAPKHLPHGHAKD